MTGLPEPPTSDAVLTAPTAGGRAIRGGVIRVVGYGVAMVLTAGAAVILLRYLGVEDSGRYVTVTALIGIVAGITDAGLTVVGQREYVTRRTVAEQRELTALVLGMRLVLTPVAVGAGVLFALAAGYDRDMVAGAALAGAGLVLANAAASLSLPLQAELRFGAVTLTDVARQAVITIGIGILAAAGAGFVALFVPHILGGAAGLAVTWLFVRRAAPGAPRLEPAKMLALARQAAPVAASLVLNVLYLRLLVLMTSLLADERETGLFGASFRVMEAFIALPVLMVGAAFPILAHAGSGDEARLAYALQRLAEAALLAGAGLALVLAIAAEPVVVLLGGREFEDAAGVLRIQSLVLVAAFLTQVWAFGLVALRRQRALIVINGVAVVTVVVLGALLIPAAGAEGGAIAAVAGETALAVTALVLLVRARPGLRPHVGRLPRVLAAVAAGSAAWLLPVPAVAAAAVAAAVFAGVAFALRAVPDELLAALPRRSQSAS